MIDFSSLHKYSLFGGIAAEEIERIKPMLGSASYDAGREIIGEGQPNDRIHFILEGRVSVSKRGRDLVELGEGDTFGEMEFLDVMPAAATIRALVPVNAAILTNKALHAIYSSNPRTFAIMMMNLARDLSRHLRRMDEKATAQNDPDSREGHWL
jgi:CRP/FNR family cyclic AMP-dependent transcriptional regulator